MKFFYVLIFVLISNLAIAQTGNFDDLLSLIEPEKKEVETEKPIEKNITIPSLQKDLEAAPFGLFWKTKKSDVERINVKLTPFEDAQNPQTFVAENLPNPLPDIGTVYLSFGEEDTLWRIVGVSNLINDDASGTNVLKTYNELVELLSKKYGEAEKFHKTDGEDKINKINYDLPQNFMKGILNHRNMHFSTFQDKFVHIQISIGANSETESFYSIVYRSNEYMDMKEKIKEQKLKSKLDAL